MLNSRAEYNRCAIPRLGLKLGEKDYKEMRKEEKEEDMKEETIMTKIKELRKRRNKERGEKRRKEFRNKVKEPDQKRRKIYPENETTDEQREQNRKPPKAEAEKRSLGSTVGGPKSKQLKLDMFLTPESPALPSQRPTQPLPIHREEEPPPKDEGYPTLNLDTDLLYDWEGKFEEHKKIMEEERSKREERLTRAGKLSTGWELAKVCRQIIKESSNSWREESKMRKEKKRVEEESQRIEMIRMIKDKKEKIKQTVAKIPPVSYTHLTLPTICSV